MQEKTAHNVVQLLAGVVWLYTAFITAITIMTLVKWKFFSPEGLELYRGTPVMLAVVHLLAIVILGIAIGIGLWQKKQWARILGIVFCIIVILESLIFLFANPLQWGLFMFLIGVAIILWLLAAYEPVKKLFKK